MFVRTRGGSATVRAALKRSQHPRAAIRLFSEPAAALPTGEVGNRPSAFVTHQGSQYYQWPQEYDVKAERAAKKAKANRVAEWAPVPTPNAEGYKGLSLYEVCADYLIKNGPTKINDMWFHIKSKGMVATRRELRCWVDQDYVNKLDRMHDKQRVDPMPWETRDRWVDMMQVCRRWRYRSRGAKKKRLKKNLRDEGSLDNKEIVIPRKLPLVCMPNPSPLDAGDEEQLVFDLNPYRRTELIAAHRERMERRRHDEQQQRFASEPNDVDDPDKWWYQVLDGDWYYKHAYEGPVTTAELKALLASGEINNKTRVWNFVKLRFWQPAGGQAELSNRKSLPQSDEGGQAKLADAAD